MATIGFLALLPLGLLGGYARLGRGGWRWSLGIPLFSVPYLGGESKDDLEHYKTLVFVRTESAEVGRYVRPGGADAGANAQRLKVVFVDADHPERRRVVHAGSQPAERIKGNEQTGGSHHTSMRRRTT